MSVCNPQFITIFINHIQKAHAYNMSLLNIEY